MASSSPPIRVVVFSGGPALAWDVVGFLERLEGDPAVDLAGVFAETRGRGIAALLADLWRRRGWLGVPLAMRGLCRGLGRRLLSPRLARRRRAVLEALRERTHYVKDLHGATVLRRVRELAPDLGLVYGGPIIRRELFEIPRRGTLGIHHGKLPEYRGKKTTFWAVHNGEERVGVAIQRIGARLDGGEIVMAAEVGVGKRPLPVLVKQLEDIGIETYLKAIHAVREGSAVYRPQPAAGTLYKDPGVVDILRYWWRYCARLARN